MNEFWLYDDFVEMPYSRVEDAWKTGHIDDADFDRYCYAWRVGAPRFTNLGLAAANRHAARMGLPPLGRIE